MARCKVIYFDLDGTLVDYEADASHAFGKARECAVERYPDTAGKLTVEIFRRSREATYIQYGDTGLPLKDWYRECMKVVLESVGIFDIALAGRMGQLYGLFRNTTLKVFDDALEVVPKLAGRYQLGLLSNGSSKVQKLPIAEFFAYSVYAREVGHEKPAPEIFHAAAAVAGCANGEMLYVGDGQYTDILGARNAGIEMVWINRTGAGLLAGIPQPDHEIRDLREIYRIAPI
ncbi:MAG: HAD family hydrolase [Candidatus Lindowbacteria bacterium]|nr:HAD family hydrolase [Candidatus Lindowbacteria bacterium]